MNTQVAVNQEFYPFMFDQIRLKESCWINNEPHFTRRAIGEWLDYRYPQEAIDRIIQHNPHIDEFSAAVRLTVTDANGSDGSQVNLTCEQTPSRHREIETSVYNPIGLQLIIFESHQPKAKAYKVAVAHLVYAFMRGELKPPKNIKYQNLYIQCKEALELAPYQERPIAVKYLATKYGKTDGTIYLWMKRIGRGENPAETRGNRLTGCLYINKDTEAKIRALIDENPKITIKEIVRQMPQVDCSAYHAVRRLRKRIKEQLKPTIISRLENSIRLLN